MGDILVPTAVKPINVSPIAAPKPAMTGGSPPPPPPPPPPGSKAGSGGPPPPPPPPPPGGKAGGTVQVGAVEGDTGGVSKSWEVIKMYQTLQRGSSAQVLPKPKRKSEGGDKAANSTPTAASQGEGGAGGEKAARRCVKQDTLPQGCCLCPSPPCRLCPQKTPCLFPNPSCCPAPPL